MAAAALGLSSLSLSFYAAAVTTMTVDVAVATTMGVAAANRTRKGCESNRSPSFFIYAPAAPLPVTMQSPADPDRR